MDWYVYRRINSFGLVWNKNGDAWLGKFFNKAFREENLKWLLATNQVIACSVEGL